jgi:hypothetical protein
LSRNTNRNGNSEFDRARDELFSHIHRCGVIKASEDQQIEWMEDTVDFMSERFTGLGRDDLGELRTLGLRFCSPVIDNVQAEETPAGVVAEEATVEAAAA